MATKKTTSKSTTSKTPTKKKSPAKKATTTKKTTTKTKKTTIDKKQSILIYELKLVALITVSVILAFALHTNAIGIFGVYSKKLIFGLFANAGYIIPYLFFVIVFVQINHNLEEVRVKYIFASVFLFLSVLLTITTLSHDVISETLKFNHMALFSSDGVAVSFTNGIQGNGGGVLGNWITFALISIFGKMGTYIIAICLMLGFFVLGTRMSVSEMIEKRRQAQRMKKEERQLAVQMTTDDLPNSAKVTEHTKNESKLPIKKKSIKDFDSDSYIEEKISDVSKKSLLTATLAKNEDVQNDSKKEDVKEAEIPQIKFNSFVPTAIEEVSKNDEDDIPLTKAEEKEIIKTMEENNKPAYKDYVMPSIEMLKVNSALGQTTSKGDLLDKARLLEETLLSFGVEAKVVQVSQGPTITMYELQPSPGVKVSKIVGLSDDIALNLAAHHVRVAPIPGKAAVGIEVPNENTSMVMMRDVIETKEFKKSTSKLSFCSRERYIR